MNSIRRFRTRFRGKAVVGEIASHTKGSVFFKDGALEQNNLCIMRQ